MLVMASVNSPTETSPHEPFLKAMLQDTVTKPTACVAAASNHDKGSGPVDSSSVAVSSKLNNAETPTVVPLNPALIGVLPNGVHVSKVAQSYNGEVQSAIKKVLPTTTEAVKAFNLTTQLALQCMMNIKSAQLLSQNRSILPRPLEHIVELEEQVTSLKSNMSKQQLQMKHSYVQSTVPLQEKKEVKAPMKAKPKEKQAELLTFPPSLEEVAVPKPLTKEITEEKQESPEFPKMNDFQLIVKDCKTDLQQRKRKTGPEEAPSTPSLKRPKLDAAPDLGYVKRMASLNARARVTALIEPERKPPPKSAPKGKGSATKKTSKSAKQMKKQNEQVSATLAAAALSKLAESGGLEAGQYVAIHHPMEIAQPEFNTLGLLYDGSTIHPSATRVFYSTLSGDLVLPKIVLPVLFPTKLATIGGEIEKVERLQKGTKKTSKSNNGWMVIGDPIKAVKYAQSEDVGTTRKYFIGIQRKKERIFVRDCVMLRAGKDEKPYIGKIASIWKENDGLMITLFWYYRPEEVDPASTAGMHFKENELLASQHFDVNSVACIEDKCYILGLRQYSRYYAAMTGSKHIAARPHRGLIPSLPSRELGSSLVSHVKEYGMSHDQEKSFLDLGASVEELVQAETSLIHLCYRGYNHISGRIYQL